MRLNLLIAFIAAFTSLLFPAALEKFLNRSFEPGPSVQTAPFASSARYVLVSADGIETYVFDISNGAPVSDAGTLEAILTIDVKNRSNYAYKLESALGFPAAVRKAKETNESKCMQYTGVDKRQCSDFESCKISCLSVPLCEMSAYHADGFVETMLDWNQARQGLDILLSDYEAGLGSVASSTSQIDSKSSMLSIMAELSSVLSSNTIFLNRTDPGCAGSNAALRCFEYCPKADYSAERIAAQKANLASLKSLLLEISRQKSRASAMLSAGQENEAYLSSRAGDYQEFSMEMYNGIRKLNSSLPAYLEKVDDAETTLLLASLSGFFAQADSYADAGMYRKALSQKPLYEGMQKNISGRMKSGTADFDNLTASFSAFDSKVQKASGLIGAQRAAGYVARGEEIKAIAKPPATLEEISTAKKTLSALEAELYGEVSANALGEQAAWPQSSEGIKLPEGASIPCLPALALIPLAGFAFARGRRRL